MTKLTNHSTILAIRITVDTGKAPDIAALLALLDMAAVQTENVDTGDTVFEFFPPDHQTALRFRDTLRKCLPRVSGNRKAALQLVRLQQRDWAESWKRFHHTNRVSRRIVIRPSWESYKPKRGEHVIELDPGMSFGTGLHPTTKACLRFIDDITQERDRSSESFLDVGCGSGVLMIAAGMLGFGRVVGIDNDPVAVRTAMENASRNGVKARASCLCRNSATFRTRNRFDLVAANMLMHELEPTVEMISRVAAAGDSARVIIAGTLGTQLPAIVALFRKAGFKLLKKVNDGDWASACFGRA